MRSVSDNILEQPEDLPEQDRKERTNTHKSSIYRRSIALE
jgi:hypothetical protein